MAPPDLLRPLEGQREATLGVVASLGEEDLARVEEDTGWTVRSILAHIATSELRQAFLIQIAAKGQVVHMSPEERDQANQDAVARVESWDRQRLQAELADSRTTLREVFSSLTEEDLDRAIRWPEWPARSIRTSIPYMLEHEDSHMDQVRSALGGR